MEKANVTDPRAGMWRNRFKLILLFLLFFAPAVLAWLLVLGGWRPAGASHHGMLIQPPVPVAELPLTSGTQAPVDVRTFDGRWSMLLITAGPCEASCEYALDRLMRVHIALNKDADRVRLLLVLPQAVPTPPGLPDNLAVLQLPPAMAAELAGGAASAEIQPAVHLVDPYGFRMMQYPSPLDAQGLLKDLRRLLRLSNEEIERLRRAEASHG
jgi:hypothetical protein